MSTPRIAPPTAGDRTAFAVVLDSIPAGGAKVDPSGAEGRSRASNDPKEAESSFGRQDLQPILLDSAFLSSLPFALPSAPITDETQTARPETTLLAQATKPGAKPEDNQASDLAPSQPRDTAAMGRLIGERSFHFGGSVPGAGSNRLFEPSSVGTLPSPSAEPSIGLSADTDNLLAEATLDGEKAVSAPVADVARSRSGALAPPPSAPPVEGRPANPTASMTRLAQEPTRGSRRSEPAAPPPVARAAGSAAAPAAVTTDAKNAVAGPADSNPFTEQPAQSGSAFGAPLSAPSPTGPSWAPFEPSGKAGDIAPRATSAAAGRAAHAPPVKEIDVDLSPAGLEEVSMTMRLAGEKLSVVIRAASSQTYGSLEGARDAIADRLAAIGQPLDSLVIRQTGANIDGGANANAASRDDGAAAGDRRLGQSSGERGDANDPSASRRGAGRDRGF
jgi:hypothetical protein